MEFKDLEDAKKYIEVKMKELEDTKAKLEKMSKDYNEQLNKNNELIKTNSQLLGDIANMQSKTSKEKEDDKEQIEDLFIKGEN